MTHHTSFRQLLFVLTFALVSLPVVAQTAPPERTVKPVLHAKHWVAITGKPLAATAGALVFHKGGNAVDAAVATQPGQEVDGLQAGKVGPQRHIAGHVGDPPVQRHRVVPGITAEQ